MATQAVALGQWPTVILAPACIKLTLVVGSVKGISGGQALGSHSLFTVSGKSRAIYSDVIPAPRSRPAYDPQGANILMASYDQRFFSKPISIRLNYFQLQRH